MKPKFFATPKDFRTWLEKHHADTAELWVGFYKKASGRASITWPESVDRIAVFYVMSAKQEQTRVRRRYSDPRQRCRPAARAGQPHAVALTPRRAA